MTALATERDTKARGNTGFVHELPVVASDIIYAGSLVCVDSADGYAKPGAVSTTLTAVGRADSTYDNSSGAAGAINCKAREGVFKFGNSSAGDAIADTEIGATCYIVDDQTVAKTNGTSTRSAAGKVVKVDADGVWVKVGFVG